MKKYGRTESTMRDRSAPEVRFKYRQWLLWTLLGSIFNLKVIIFGELYLGEICLATIFVVNLFKGRGLKDFQWILVFGFMFAFFQLLSDIYNGSKVASSIKGVGAPILFAINIMALLPLFKVSISRFYAVVIGGCVVALVQTYFWPTEYQAEDPWKWGYGPVVLSLGAVLFSLKRAPLLFLILAGVLFSIISLLNGARSLGALPLFGIMLHVFWNFRILGRVKRWIQGGAAAIKVMVLVLPLVAVMNLAFASLLTSEIIQSRLDQESAEKYRRQAESEVGLLLAGRSEWLVSINAFLDAPWLGHGSWAEDRNGYLSQYVYLSKLYGISDTVAFELRGDLIPAHSFVLGALVWCGIAGGIFWLIFFYRIFGVYVDSAKLLPVYFHIGMVLFFWNLLFSPFAAQTRWMTSIYVAGLLAASVCYRQGIKRCVYQS